MTRDTEKHFSDWLFRNVHESEQEQVWLEVHKLVNEYPDLLETRSWPEMRSLAERNYRVA